MATNLDDDRKIPTNPFVRLLFVILLNLFNMVISKLIVLLALYEFFCHLFTGRVTERSVRWGEAMSSWTYRMLLFMTYKTEHMPFPFHLFGPGPDRD